MRIRKWGFTLIELLIVVAIIAILAAIAVPNLLEAQVRSKVSRVKADMRSYATALESYAVDNNAYPPTILFSPPFDFGIVPYPIEMCLVPLSTPIAYMTDALIPEPFNGKQGWALFRGWDAVSQYGTVVSKDKSPIYFYVALPKETDEFASALRGALVLGAAGYGLSTFGLSDADQLLARKWYLVSPGPDTFFTFDAIMKADPSTDTTAALIQELAAITLESANGVYDPTNGSVSAGELVRTNLGIFNNK